METEDGDVLGYVSVLESGTMQEEADAAADKMKRKASKQVRSRHTVFGFGFGSVSVWFRFGFDSVLVSVVVSLVVSVLVLFVVSFFSVWFRLWFRFSTSVWW